MFEIMSVQEAECLFKAGNNKTNKRQVEKTKIHSGKKLNLTAQFVDYNKKTNPYIGGGEDRPDLRTAG